MKTIDVPIRDMKDTFTTPKSKPGEHFERSVVMHGIQAYGNEVYFRGAKIIPAWCK